MKSAFNMGVSFLDDGSRTTRMPGGSHRASGRRGGHPTRGLRQRARSYSAPSAGIVLPAGELLVDPTAAFLVQSFAPGISGTSPHAIPVPFDVTLIGAHVFMQALVVTSNQLTNAIDLDPGS
jgi:hypothetical protein